MSPLWGVPSDAGLTPRLTEPGRPTYIQLGPERAAAKGHTRVEPFGGPRLVSRLHSSLATGLAAGVLRKHHKAQVPGLGPGECSQGPVGQDDLTPCPTPDTRGPRAHAAQRPRGCHVIPGVIPKAAGPAGQTAGRATCGVRALVAPGALLKPATEAERRGPRPIGVQRRPEGRRRVRWRSEWRPRHMRESRARKVGEPRGSAQEGPDGWRAVRDP